MEWSEKRCSPRVKRESFTNTGSLATPQHMKYALPAYPTSTLHSISSTRYSSQYTHYPFKRDAYAYGSEHAKPVLDNKRGSPIPIKAIGRVDEPVWRRISAERRNEARTTIPGPYAPRRMSTRSAGASGVDGASAQFSAEVSSVVSRATTRGRASHRAGDVEAAARPTARGARDGRGRSRPGPATRSRP